MVRDFNSENCFNYIEMFADESRDWLYELSFYGDSLITIVGGLSCLEAFTSLLSSIGEEMITS